MFKAPSPAFAVSIVALVIALGGAGYSATGGNFILGVSNSASTQTSLISTNNGQALQIRNNSTGLSATALGLVVPAGRPPLATGSRVKVNNLNVDLLDGVDSADLARKVGEGWNYIGEPGKPAFQNGWVNFNGPGFPPNEVTYQHAAYRIDPLGVVHLGGLVSGGPVTSTIFTLPVEYCPFFTKVFPALANNALSRVTINRQKNGCAVFTNFGSNAWVSLEGVSFLSADLEQRIN